MAIRQDGVTCALSLHQIKTAKYHRTYNTPPRNIRQVKTFSEFKIKLKRCLKEQRLGHMLLS